MFDVTLTFDNGPEPEVTPAVLDVLARKEVAATFFVLGHKLADPERRALAERAAAEGHWIGNHTYTHETPLGRLPGEDVPEREIGRTQALIGSLGHPDRRSEEHTSELQSLMRNSYAVFCLKKKKHNNTEQIDTTTLDC